LTADAIRDAVRNLCGVSSTYADLTDANIHSYVHEAMLLAAYEAAPMALRVAYAQNSVDGTHTYAAYTAPVLFVASAKANGQPVPLIDQDQLDNIAPNWEATTKAAAQKYAVIADHTSGILNVRFWPTPNYSTANAIVIRSIKEPTAPSGTSEITEFPEFLHHGFVKYAAYRHLLNQTETGSNDNKHLACKTDWEQAKLLYVQFEQDNNSVQSRRAMAQRVARA